MARVLVAARNISLEVFKGAIVVIVEDDHVWGRLETLPNWIQLDIPGIPKEQMVEYLHDWPLKFDFNILNTTAEGWRVEAIVDPVYLDASQTQKFKIKQEMQDHIESSPLWIGCVVRGFTTESLTVDIPNTLDRAVLKRDFNDIFEDTLGKRYYFNPTDVDTAISQGGQITLTKTQAINRIIDKMGL